MTKAFRLDEIDAALDKFRPITPGHPFFVDFSNLRGDYQARQVIRMLNVSGREGSYTFNAKSNQTNKTLLFLAGMRGSGKTSELARYAEQLHRPECFFVVTCNVDEELDMDHVEYMDILIFQIEKLLVQAHKVGLSLSDSILEDLNIWFQERVEEINRGIGTQAEAAIGLGSNNGLSLWSRLIGITAELKTSLSGSYERSSSIRTNLKNRFVDFSRRFNTFIEQVNEQLRREGKGQEVLFIVDGLEKTMSADTRRRIIMEESNRIRQIQANTVFTLPIELMKEEQRIRQFAELITFPFVKLKERDGSPVDAARERFEEFVLKRIDRSLFDDMETLRLAIAHSGGSPRQLLRIIERAAWELEEGDTQICRAHMDKALDGLSNSFARYLEPVDFEVLRKMKTELEQGHPIGFANEIQGLLEKEIVFEYNDGTYKCVNPLVARSKLYQHHVAKATK